MIYHVTDHVAGDAIEPGPTVCILLVFHNVVNKQDRICLWRFYIDGTFKQHHSNYFLFLRRLVVNDTFFQ